MPFASETKRFDPGVTDKLSPIRGPGYYEYAEQSSMSSNLARKGGSTDYFTSAKRFEHGSYLDQSRLKMLPCPGYYALKDDALKKNKSFNLMFN